MAEALAAHPGQRDFDTALIADDSAMLHALVLSAQALPIGYRAKDSGAKQTVAFRLERAVIDSFRLGDFTVRPTSNFFRRRKTDSDRIEVGDQVRSIVGGRSIHRLS